MAAGVQHAQSSGFSTGRVFGRAFGTIAANPIAAVGIALLFGALPSEAYEYAYTHLVPPTSPSHTSMLIAGGLVGSIVAMFFPVLTQGAFTRLTIAHEEGRRPGFAEAGITG